MCHILREGFKTTLLSSIFCGQGFYQHFISELLSLSVVEGQNGSRLFIALWLSDLVGTQD